jgi:hypothetical protein
VKNKAVDLGGIPIRPLPKEMFESVLCTNCKEQAAKWELAKGAEQAWTYCCSFCLLYEMPQTKEQRLQVDYLIDEVEKKAKTGFSRKEDGRLITAQDADRIAFGIVMSQRFMESRMLRGGFGS